jgi:hypothetical protein
VRDSLPALLLFGAIVLGLPSKHAAAEGGLLEQQMLSDQTLSSRYPRPRVAGKRGDRRFARAPDGRRLLLSAARQNDIVKKLGSWAAILAVPTAIAGIYGMNFKNMPELKCSFGYPASLLLMLAICSTLYYCFRRAAWL